MIGGTHSDRVTIVTGAASGIGRATGELLAAGGASVVAVDLDVERLSWASKHEQIAVVAGDVCSAELNAEAVSVALRRFGRLDASVLNARIPVSGDLVDGPIDAFDRSFEVNVRAVLLGIRAAVPAMRATGAGGRIPVTASTSGLAADPSMWAYNAAKAAVINLVRAAAVDLAAEAITVNASARDPPRPP